MTDRRDPQLVSSNATSVWRGRARLLAVLCIAAVVRVAMVVLHGDPLRFGKYTRAAKLLASGHLTNERVADFSPLYLGIHSLALWLGDASGRGVQWLQVLVGCGVVGMVFVLARRMSGELAGVLAGVCAALSLDAALYDVVLEGEPWLISLSVLAVLLVLDAAMRPFDRQSVLAFGVSGLASAAAIACRPTSWIVVAPLLLLGARLRSGRASSLAAYVLCLALGVGVLHVHDTAHGAKVAMSPWQVVYTGNNPLANGLWRDDFLIKDLESEGGVGGPDAAHQVFRDVAVASGQPAQSADFYWRDLSLAFGTRYPGALLRLWSWKLLALGQAYRPHDIGAVFGVDRALAGWPLVSTAWIIPLGLLGLWLRPRRTWPLLLIAAGQVGVCLLFFVSSRYRLFLLPWTCVGCGVLCAELLALFRAGRGSRLRLALLLAAGLLLLGIVRAPLPPAADVAPTSELERSCHEHYEQATQAWRDGRMPDAGERLAPCVSLSPWIADKLALIRVPFDLRTIARRLLDSSAKQSATQPEPWRSYRLAYLWLYAGEPARAAPLFVRAAATSGGGLGALAYDSSVRAGMAFLLAGRAPQAQAAFETAAQLRPGAAAPLLGLSLLGPNAAQLRERALAVNPRLEVLYIEGRMNLQLGRVSEALPALAKLVTALPHYGRGRMLLATALHLDGQLDEARSNARRAQVDFGVRRDTEYTPLPIFEAAAKAAPDKPLRWLELARVAEIYGDYATAVRAFGSLAAARPLQADEQVELANLHLLHGRLADARSSVARALEVDPANERARGLAQQTQHRRD